MNTEHRHRKFCFLYLYGSWILLYSPVPFVYIAILPSLLNVNCILSLCHQRWMNMWQKEEEKPVWQLFLTGMVDNRKDNTAHLKINHSFWSHSNLFKRCINILQVFRLTDHEEIYSNRPPGDVFEEFFCLSKPNCFAIKGDVTLPLRSHTPGSRASLSWSAWNHYCWERAIKSPFNADKKTNQTFIGQFLQ